MRKVILTLLLTGSQLALGGQDELLQSQTDQDFPLKPLSLGIKVQPGAPRQFRVSLQFIEVPHTALTEMLASHEKNGQTLHDKAMALKKSGQGKMIESSMVVSRFGQRATVQSNLEVIFPTEYEPPDLPTIGGWLPPFTERHPSLRNYLSFEPRNTGVTFEVLASTTSNGMIELRLAPEIVTQVRMENWMEHVDQWGDASMRMPIFECLRFTSSITLKPGKFEFTSALSHKMNAQGPVVQRKVLVFVRADLLPSPW
jgi:hypothetical protein